MRVARPRNSAAETGGSSPSSASPFVINLACSSPPDRNRLRPIIRCTKNLSARSKRITSPVDTLLKSKRFTKTRSPDRIHGVMLPPSTRKHTEPCARIFLEISDADSVGREMNCSFSSIRGMAAVAAIRESIPPFETQRPGRQAKRAPSTLPSYAVVESRFRLRGGFGSPQEVRWRLALHRKPSAFVDTDCRQEAEFPEFARDSLPARSARRLSLPSRESRWR